MSPIIEKLTELLIEEAQSLGDVRREVESLKNELEIIEPFLKDAEAKAEKGEVGDASKAWLRQIRKESDRIEDVVDDYYYRVEQHRSPGGFLGPPRKVSHWIKALTRRYDIASEIRDIKVSLREIKDRGVGYGLRPLEQGSSSKPTNGERLDSRLGSLFMEEDEVVCIDAVSEELIKRLTEGESVRSVVSLVGQGGIGKTTLARKVYKDEVVKAHFDCHAWITVSQSYDMKMLLRYIARQVRLPERVDEECSMEELIIHLRQFLQTKRYVVVFDDVWKEEIWEAMQYAFPNNDKGSRIIITTRNVDVVAFSNGNSCDLVKELQTWPLEMAWQLFCKKAFRNELEGRCPQELKQLSLEILSKCQGLPLAISTIAGILSTREKIDLEWKRVLDNLNSEYDKTDIKKILSLSYVDLPHHLRCCFLYFGIFPEDYRIYDTKLYELWIAEGFVKARANKTPEEVAQEYLNELLQRNIVLFEKKYGISKECRVHDLMYEIILTNTGELSFCRTLKRHEPSIGEKSRRLSINGTTEDVLKTVGDSGTRSVFLFGMSELSKAFIVGLCKKCRLLKVLDFSNSPLDNLPKEVGNLSHLKYLSLRGTKVKILPKSIGKLCNLQTLDVCHTLVRELPIETYKLTKLRHLAAYSFEKQSEYGLDCYRGVRIPEGIGRLEDLQTLTRVEAYHGRDVGLAEELQKLTNLRSLSIIQVTAEMGKALGESIEKMNCLEQLTLTSEHEVLDLRWISSPPPLHWLQLNCRLQQLPDWIPKLSHLQVLDLKFSRLTDEPLKYLKGLPNLVFLRLHQTFDGEELHFEEGGFRKLKDLRLIKLEGLKAVKIDNGALPLLEKFEFGPSPLMKEMSFDFQYLPSLKALEIFNLPREFVLSLQPDGGPHYWKIQHIPSVKFFYKRSVWKFDVYKLGSSDLLQRLREDGR